MICFQRALAATVRAVGGPQLLNVLQARVENAAKGFIIRPLLYLNIEIRAVVSDKFRRIPPTTVWANCIMHRNELFQGGGEIPGGKLNASGTPAGAFPKDRYHFAILTARSSKRNGPLVLAHAGGK
jgi:hypothetical protein